jgi:toxin ParE1/3/4
MPRAKARADVELAVEHYANEAGADVALAFIAALQRSYAVIGEMPAAGSPRWSSLFKLPGLRTTRLKGYPWLVFHVEFETHGDVWRVLHAKRDIPVWLTDEGDE